MVVRVVSCWCCRSALLLLGVAWLGLASLGLGLGVWLALTAQIQELRVREGAIRVTDLITWAYLPRAHHQEMARRRTIISTLIAITLAAAATTITLLLLTLLTLLTLAALEVVHHAIHAQIETARLAHLKHGAT